MIRKIFLCMCLVFGFCGCAQKDILETDILKAGKADAIVLLHQGKTMVIDTGEEDDGEDMVSFLQNKKVASIDTLIITHFDKDHVGGADTLIRNMDVNTIYLPDYVSEHPEYVSFMTALQEKGYTPVYLERTESFSFGNAEVTIEPPLSYEPYNNGEPDNNFSLITTVVHGDNRLVFAGDIEKERIAEWVDTDPGPCTFLKLPHHGVYNKNLSLLLEELQPAYVAITSSDKNPAEENTLALLQTYTKNILETKDGHITVISDGKTIRMSN
ncbi:MAG: MBL fold metallo-hydrolase [Solobacterium sp.]|nr:MBL fold metallo-hydrolase [Solobacterium sp.]